MKKELLGEIESVVVLVPAPLVPAPVFGVPDPTIVIPLPAMVMPEVIVQVPAGMTMTFPSMAVCVGPLMTAFTSERLQLAAVNVPCALSVCAVNGDIRTNKVANKSESVRTLVISTPLVVWAIGTLGNQKSLG